jgi:16S rRNA C967 or C1407 C5-methylase (RsmB/RsmF family)
MQQTFTNAQKLDVFRSHSLCQLAENEQKNLLDSLAQNAPSSIRYNPFKYKYAIQNPVAWSQFGEYITKEQAYALDPHWHAGAYYVQEASSMFLEKALAMCLLPQQAICLDLCAAPGGKSTHLLSLLQPDQILISNEVIRSRVAVLKENIVKWGCENVVITHSDASQFSNLGAIFDLVLVDAPCSGEGLLRKDPAALDHWSTDAVQTCSLRQQRILTDIQSTIKPGGYLIYATCTYNTIENEENMAWFTSKYGFKELAIIHSIDSITRAAMGYKFFPHKTVGEGFYLCLLQKQDGPTKEIPFKRKSNFESFPKANLVEKYLLQSNNYEILQYKDIIKLMGIGHKYVVDYLANSLNIITAGLDVAHWLKAKELLPEHGLAMSRLINPSHFDPIALDLPAAQLYLKRELLDVNCANGLHLACYEGLCLGFFKKINTRINNQYPQEWRLRMAL